jgi:hypothetical protein
MEVSTMLMMKTFGAILPSVRLPIIGNAEVKAKLAVSAANAVKIRIVQMRQDDEAHDAIARLSTAFEAP